MERLELYLSSEKAVKAANEFRAAVTRAADAVDRIGKDVDQLDRGFDKVGGGANRAANPVRRVGKEAQASAQAMRVGAAGAADYERRLDRLQRTAAITGGSVTRLIAILGGVAAVRGAVRTFAEYEDRLAVLGTVAGATGQDLEALEDAARGVSRETRLFKTSDAVQGLTELARAGLDSSQSIAALKPTADLATVGLIGLDKSAGIVTKTLAQYGLAADEASRVADVLAKGANSTNTDVSGLAFSLSKAGVSAKQFGVDLETTVAALGELANKGVQADRAGTGLARIMIRLANPTDRAKEALRELGLSVEDINPSANGLIQVLRNLSAANLTLGQSTKLVDTEFADLLAQLSNSVPNIERLERALLGAGGTSAEQAAARFNTLGGAFSNLGGAAEEFSVALGEGGLGTALKDVTNLSAEALRVLTGDSEAFLNASDGAKALATGLRAITVAGAAFVSLKLGTSLQGLAAATRAAVTSTITLDAATGTLAKTSTVASRAAKGLTAAFAANPIGLVATAVGAAAAAFLVFGDSTDEATARIEEQQKRLDELDRRYRSLGDSIQEVADKLSIGVAPDRAELQAASSQVEKLAIQFEKAARAGAELQEIEGLEKLAAAGFLPDGSDAAGLLELVRRFREAQEQADRLAESVTAARARVRQLASSSRLGVGAAAEQDRLRELVARYKQAETSAQQLNEALAQQGVVVNNLGQLFIEPERGAGLLGAALERLQEVAKGAGVAIQKALGVDTSAISSIVSKLIQDEEQRVELQKLQADGASAEVLLFRAKLAVSRDLTKEEEQAIRSAATRIDAETRVAEAIKEQNREAKRLADQQAGLPSKLDEIESRLRAQLAIAESEGELRTRLIAEQKAAAALPPITLIDEKDPERAAKLREQYEAIRALFVDIERADAATKEQRQETRRDDRSTELFRRLAQEEALVSALGDEKQRLAIIQAAENEAVAAGIEKGSLLAKQYEERVLAVERLARTQEEFGRTFGQAGQVIGDGLFDAIRQAEDLDDALRNVIERLGQLAFQKAVTDNLSKLLTVGGEALAKSLFGGSASTEPPPGDGSFVPRLAGGLIPAMTGQLVASPSILSRGGRNYSVAEGGGVTPEAIFPLQRDSQGRLGVVAAGGGGGDQITMVFPSVRNSQDARGVRATRGQIARRVRDADRRGRRGLRPRGE